MDQKKVYPVEDVQKATTWCGAFVRRQNAMPW